jgi:hypothetical protein
MPGRRVAALLLATVALAGCGEKPEPDVSRPAAVTGRVKLERAAAAPDAGTVAGHRSPATATTRRAALAFTGRVRPPASRVTLKPAAGKAAALAVGADGRFRARASKLRRGENRFVVVATSPGRRPWAINLLITRK